MKGTATLNSQDPLPKATLLAEIQTAQKVIDKVLTVCLQRSWMPHAKPPPISGAHIVFLMQLSCHLSATPVRPTPSRILTAHTLP